MCLLWPRVIALSNMFIFIVGRCKWVQPTRLATGSVHFIEILESHTKAFEKLGTFKIFKRRCIILILTGSLALLVRISKVRRKQINIGEKCNREKSTLLVCYLV